MLNEREVAAAIGSTAYGPDGVKIGTVENFFVDDRTGVPTWVSVSTGLFGTRHSIAPAAEASVGDGGLVLPVTAEAVKAAPRLAGTHLDPAEEQALRTHYGMADADPHDDRTHDGVGSADDVSSADGPDATGGSGQGFVAGDQQPNAGATDAERTLADATVGEPTVAEPGVQPGAGSGPAAAAALDDGGMVRSEEQLRVGTEQVGATRFRLVKYVVTEDVQITVPIRREEIRVEEVPLDAADSDAGEDLLSHGDLAEGERPGRHTAPDDAGLPDEIVLHTERPVVSVEVVPTERVRLRREVVEGVETISGQVQREQVVVDQDAGPIS
jgi:stress response protein YsnF